MAGEKRVGARLGEIAQVHGMAKIHHCLVEKPCVPRFIPCHEVKDFRQEGVAILQLAREFLKEQKP